MFVALLNKFDGVGFCLKRLNALVWEMITGYFQNVSRRRLRNSYRVFAGGLLANRFRRRLQGFPNSTDRR